MLWEASPLLLSVDSFAAQCGIIHQIRRILVVRHLTMALITFIAGVVIGGLLSWLITYAYYKKASREQKAELNQLSAKLSPKNTLADFEKMLADSTWTS